MYKLKVNLTITILFIICFSNIAHSELPFANLPNIIAHQKYYIEAWGLDGNNNICMLLAYNDTQKIGNIEFAYTTVDANGGYIVAPILIGTSIDFIPGTADFNNDGTLFIYSNTGHGWDGYLFRYSYDYLKRLPEEKYFPNINIGTSYCTKYIAGIGNIIILSGRVKQPFLSVVIDDYKNNSTKIISFEQEKGYIYPLRYNAIQLLDDNTIIFMGIDYYSINYDPYDKSLGVYKYIIDLENEKIINYEILSIAAFIPKGISELGIPDEGSGTIIKANNNYCYPILANTGNIFIELDSLGNFVPFDKAARITVEEKPIKSLSDKSVLFLKRSRELSENKFWVLSYDNFPTLILDKGESEK